MEVIYMERVEMKQEKSRGRGEAFSYVNSIKSSEHGGQEVIKIAILVQLRDLLKLSKINYSLLVEGWLSDGD